MFLSIFITQINKIAIFFLKEVDEWGICSSMILNKMHFIPKNTDVIEKTQLNRCIVEHGIMLFFLLPRWTRST